MKQLFEKYDTSGDGILDLGEFKIAMAELWKVPQSDPTIKELYKSFKGHINDGVSYETLIDGGDFEAVLVTHMSEIVLTPTLQDLIPVDQQAPPMLELGHDRTESAIAALAGLDGGLSDEDSGKDDSSEDSVMSDGELSKRTKAIQLQNRLIRLSVARDTAETEAAELEQRVYSLESEIAELTTKEAEYADHLQHQKEYYEDMNSHLTEECKRLKMELVSTSLENKNLHDQVTSLQRSVEESRMEVEQLKLDGEAQMTEAMMKHAEDEDVRRELADYKAKADKADAMAEEIKRLLDTIDDLTIMNETVEFEKMVLEKELNQTNEIAMEIVEHSKAEGITEGLGSPIGLIRGLSHSRAETRMIDEGEMSLDNGLQTRIRFDSGTFDDGPPSGHHSHTRTITRELSSDWVDGADHRTGSLLSSGSTRADSLFADFRRQSTLGLHAGVSSPAIEEILTKHREETEELRDELEAVSALSIQWENKMGQWKERAEEESMAKRKMKREMDQKDEVIAGLQSEMDQLRQQLKQAENETLAAQQAAEEASAAAAAAVTAPLSSDGGVTATGEGEYLPDFNVDNMEDEKTSESEHSTTTAPLLSHAYNPHSTAHAASSEGDGTGKSSSTRRGTGVREVDHSGGRADDPFCVACGFDFNCF